MTQIVTPRSSDVHVVNSPVDDLTSRDAAAHFFEGGVRAIEIENSPTTGVWLVIEFMNGGKMSACLKHDTLLWEEPARN